MKIRLAVATTLLVLATLACLSPAGNGDDNPSTDGGSGDGGGAVKPAAPAKASRSSPSIKGRILYASQGSIWMWTGTAGKQVAQGEQYAQPSWAPEGDKFVFVERGHSFSDLFIGTTAGEERTQLTKNQPNQARQPAGSFQYAQNSTWALRPAWAPDNQTIAYISDPRVGYMGLWAVQIAGGQPRSLAALPPGATGIDRISWSPDGKALAAAIFIGDVSQVWKVDLATRRWTQLTDLTGGAYDPAWSPDGQRLAFTARGEGGTDIWLTSLGGAELVKATKTGNSRSPAWSPDGGQLTFLAESGGSFDIWVADVSTTEQGITSVTNLQQVTDGAKVDATSGLSWAN